MPGRPPCGGLPNPFGSQAASRPAATRPNAPPDKTARRTRDPPAVSAPAAIRGVIGHFGAPEPARRAAADTSADLPSRPAAATPTRARYLPIRARYLPIRARYLPIRARYLPIRT